MIDYYEPELDVTLLGCGFLGGYHLGALYLLQQIWPQKPYNRICGASCGGVLGALVIVGLKLETVLETAMDVMRQLRSLIRNPSLLCRLSVAGILDQKLESLLPMNAHELCSGRLGISLTKVWTLENKFVSHYESRQELIDALRAGSFIPGWSGSFKAPKYKGEHFIDGAYSDNSPKFPLDKPHEDEDETNTGRHIRICAFACEVEVKPKDEPVPFELRFFGNIYKLSWKNIVRMIHAMLPAHTDAYLQYVIGGHRDMKEYLFENDLLKCKECWLVSKMTVIEKNCLDRKICLACLRLLEQVDSLTLSKSILDIYKERKSIQ